MAFLYLSKTMKYFFSRLFAISFLLFFPVVFFGQHELISHFEAGFESDPLSTERGYDYDGYIHLLSDRGYITPIDKSTGGIGERRGLCRAVFDLEDALVTLSHDGVYKFDKGNWTLIHSFTEEMWFSYEPLSTQNEEFGYFTVQDTALWQTDGTAEGTFKVLGFSSSPRLLELEGDSIHIIYEGETPLHHVYSTSTWEHESYDMPFQLASTTVQDKRVLLSGFTNHERPIYHLNTRTVEYLSTPETGFLWDRLKKIGDRYFGTHPNYFFSTLAFLRYYYYWVDLENYTVTDLDSTDQLFRHGFSDLFSTPNGLVMLKNEGDKGCEVYSVDDEFQSTLLKDIYPGMASGLHHPYLGRTSYLLNFIKNPQATSFENQVYFSALSPTQGLELWRTDGTDEGTVRISNFIEGASSPMWIRPLVIEDELYALSNDGEHNSLYRIDTDFAGYPDSFESSDQWTRYIYRDGTGYEDYHSPRKEPVLKPLRKGFIGLTQGYRKENANFTDRIVSSDGIIHDELPDVRWGYNANLLYFLNDQGGVESFEWITAYGDQCDLATDEDGENIFLVFSHKDSTILGRHSIKKPGLAIGIARLDSNGSLEWYRLFNTNRELRVHDLEVSDNQIFISGYYFSGFLEIDDGVSANSIYGPQYFVAAFDYEGTGVWAQNTPMEDLTRYSTLGHLTLDTEGKKIFTATADHTLTTWNSCEFGTWKARINALDMESGSLIWQHDFVGNDKLRIRDIEVDDRGVLWVGGNFRGTFTYANQPGLAAGGESCPTNSYLVLLNGFSGNLIRYVQDETWPKRFQHFLKRDGLMDALYLSAVNIDEHFMLPLPDRRIYAIEKNSFSLNGVRMNQELIPTRNGVYLGYDSDEAIKITACNAGSEHYIIKLFKRYGALGLSNQMAPPVYSARASTSIAKLAHAYNGNPELDPMSDFEPHGFKVYPNPLTTENLTLVIHPDRAEDFHTLKVSDMAGRQLFQTALSTRYGSAVYTLPFLSAGAYVVTVFGDDDSESQLLKVRD